MSHARLQRILRPVSIASRGHPLSFLLSTFSGFHYRHGITREQRLLSLTFPSWPSCAPVALPFPFPSTVPLYLCPTASVSTLCDVLRPSLPLLAPRSGSAASGGAARAVLPVVQLRCALCPSALRPQPPSPFPSDTLPAPLNLFSFSHWTRMVRTAHHWHHGRSGVSSSILGSRAQVAFFSLGPSHFLPFHSSLRGPS